MIEKGDVACLTQTLKTNTTLTKPHQCSKDKKKERKRHPSTIHYSFFLFLFTSTDNKIEERGATSLSEALKSNTTLTELNLWGEDKMKKTHNRSISYSLFDHSIHQTTALEKEEQHH